MRLSVLVVDDSRIARSAVARAFQQAGCEVVGLAANGSEALELYKRLKPDFVTMDLVMPEMTGQEALQAIRAYDPSAVVIVVSSMAMKPAVIECIRAGARHYLVKPFQPGAVRETLAKCFPSRYEAAAPDAG